MICLRAFVPVILGILVTIPACATGTAECPRTAALLTEGRQTVRIVAFGDSITGVYYHTGGRRAWCDMLGIALQRIYPMAKLEMINAGISGHSSASGLARIQQDVLDHKPQLVAVMFGMNDVGGSMPALHDNLVQIVKRCRGAGAEVVLMTQNTVLPDRLFADDSGRPIAGVEEVVKVVREVAEEESVPLADCYKSYEAVRAKDPMAWLNLMSEVIHPDMNGHKLFAEDVAEVISGKRVDLSDVPAPVPAIPRTLDLLAKGQPMKVIAMPPYDTMVEKALRGFNPHARVEVMTWPLPSTSVLKINDWAKTIRDQKPDLVVLAVPARAWARNDETYVRGYNWILSWAISFGYQEWDCFAILPSVTDPNLGPNEQARERLAREVIWSHDIGLVERKAGDTAPASEILGRWLKAQANG